MLKLNYYLSNNEGLRLLYSLTEGNSKAEWEDLTDSVDFKVTDNGAVSFMTNVSARFWVVQEKLIINLFIINLIISKYILLLCKYIAIK